jgi:hypothetical protein
VVPVAMESGRREDLGQPIEELEGRETEGGPTGRVGLREEIEDLVGAAADQVESAECEEGPGTIPNEPLEAVAVGGLDADAGVQAEPATVLPGQHVLGLVGFQEAVAAEVPQNPGADRVLEAFQELVGEGGGLVEAEAGFWVGRILIGVILDSLEQPVHDAQVEMVVRIQARAEAMQETDRAEGGGSRSGGAGLPQGGLEGPEQDVEDGAGGPGPVMEEGPKALGDRQDPLAHGDVGEDVIDQVGGGFDHATSPT